MEIPGNQGMNGTWKLSSLSDIGCLDIITNVQITNNNDSTTKSTAYQVPLNTFSSNCDITTPNKKHHKPTKTTNNNYINHMVEAKVTEITIQCYCPCNN